MAIQLRVRYYEGLKFIYSVTFGIKVLKVMHIQFIVSIFIMSFFHLTAQVAGDPLSGSYSGFHNGDALSLVIQDPVGNMYSGLMKDSYQSYSLSLMKTGNTIQGTATESSLNLVFQVSGTIPARYADQLILTLAIDVQGTTAVMEIAFSKQSHPTSSAHTVIIMPAMPGGAQHPVQLVGTWTKEELYQSGYGDNYMGAGFSQSMTFLSNGHMAEAGSSAHISGSNYSGQSSGGNNGIIPGVIWYALDNQLYLLVTENGVTQTYHLGRFFVEGNNLLITGTNGEKTLMHKN